MAGVEGIEPSSGVLETLILPMNYTPTALLFYFFCPALSIIYAKLLKVFYKIFLIKSTKLFVLNIFYGKITIKEGEMAKKAKKGKDYFGLGRVVSIILAIIPITAWILGFLTRFKEGKIVAGILRIFFGFNIVWLIDLVLMIVNGRIMRLLNV